MKLQVLLLIALVFSGCARMQRVETNVNSTRSEVKDLKGKILAVQQTLDDLNISQGGATNKMKADLTMQLKQLDTQLDRLQAEMDESQFRLLQMEKKLDMLANQRLVVTGMPMMDSTGTDSATGRSVKVLSGIDIEKIYNQSRDDYIAGKYDLAYKGFKNVFERPEVHGYKDNALYWMGECYYKQKKWEKAVENYQRVVKEFPKGNKICSAYFKLGMVFGEMKEKGKQKETWKTLIDSCPGSNEAHRAKDMMD